MTSRRQLQANRQNAEASTGPKTAAGKEASAKNSLRHGLSVSSSSDPRGLAAVENLALHIAGAGASADVLDCARRVAEAEFDLRRVRNLRARLLASTGEPDMSESPATPPTAPGITQPPNKVSSQATPVSSGGNGDIAASLPIDSTTLQRAAELYRYEQRALSRRKFAIRNLDSARSDAAR